MTRRRTTGLDGQPLEWVIQDAILHMLMWRANSEPIWFWRARPSQYIREQGSDVGFDLHPTEIGMPDIIGVAYGFTCAMEVKRPDGRGLNPNQVGWREQFLKADRTIYEVVRDVGGAEAVVNACRDQIVQPVRMARFDK